MARYVVAAVDEIAPGARKIVEVAGRSIGIFNVGGQYYALRNRCPHQGGPLCAGVLWAAVRASVPGAYDYSRPGEILRCPWHGWEFDLRTGQSWIDPARLRVRRYAVTIEGAAAPGNGSQDPAPGNGSQGLAPGAVPGPYVAETYATSVEWQYVVVEIPD